MATSLVTCKICKEKIDRDIAFKIKERSYCCSKIEYLEYLETKEREFQKKQEIEQELKRKKREEYNRVYCIIRDLLGFSLVNTVLNKELSELIKASYTYEDIFKYLSGNFDTISESLEKKDFDKEYAAIKYLFSIIKNDIRDYLKQKEIEKENKEYLNEPIEYDGILENVKYKEKNKRRALYEIEMEVIAEDE